MVDLRHVTYKKLVTLFNSLYCFVYSLPYKSPKHYLSNVVFKQSMIPVVFGLSIYLSMYLSTDSKLNLFLHCFTWSIYMVYTVYYIANSIYVCCAEICKHLSAVLKDKQDQFVYLNYLSFIVFRNTNKQCSDLQGSKQA